jgi:hypothetical protein
LAHKPDTNCFLNDYRVFKGFDFYGKYCDKHWIKIAHCKDYPELKGYYLWDSGIIEYDDNKTYFTITVDSDWVKKILKSSNITGNKAQAIVEYVNRHADEFEDYSNGLDDIDDIYDILNNLLADFIEEKAKYLL